MTAHSGGGWEERQLFAQFNFHPQGNHSRYERVITTALLNYRSDKTRPKYHFKTEYCSPGLLENRCFMMSQNRPGHLELTITKYSKLSLNLLRFTNLREFVLRPLLQNKHYIHSPPSLSPDRYNYSPAYLYVQGPTAKGLSHF